MLGTTTVFHLLLDFSVVSHRAHASKFGERSLSRKQPFGSECHTHE